MRAFWLTAYEQPVQTELFKLGHRNLLMNAVADFILPCVVAASAWGVVPDRTLAIWLTFALAADGMAWLMWLGWRPTVARGGQPSATRMQVWQWTHLLTVSVMGASWGYVGMLYVPGNEVHNLLIITGFQGVLAYSAASNASHELMAFVVSLVCGGVVMTTYVSAALLHDSAYMYAMLWLFLGALCVVAYNAHQAMLVSIRLRLANGLLAVRNAEAAAQAQQANRDKSEFLAAASHDLRQPVHALLLLIEALRAKEREAQADLEAVRGKQGQAERVELIGHIASAGQSIASLFNALMELSRLESGTEQALVTPVPVAALLTQCVERHALQAQAKGLTLRARVATSVKDAVTHTDRVLLERMLGNLLSNALRYTPSGGVLVSLRRGLGGALLIEVWDTGIGIASEHAERIFSPYFQVGNRERDRSKGLGLGLAIVRQSAQLLGLRLQVRSELDRGSCFRLVLPKWQHEPTMMAEPLAAPVSVGDTRTLAGRRVLLVDDDPMVRQAMQTLLTGWGVDLRQAGQAEDLQPAQWPHGDWQPECILSDYRLPGSHNGIELLNLLSDRWPQAVGVLQTGELAEQVQAEAEDAGYAVMYKPVPASLLASTLRAVLAPA